jgi:hypothetical protein
MLDHATNLRLIRGVPMKLLLLLLLGVVGSALGIMLTEGTVKYVFQISFFCVIGVALLTSAIDL